MIKKAVAHSCATALSVKSVTEYLEDIVKVVIRIGRYGLGVVAAESETVDERIVYLDDIVELTAALS